MTAGLRAYRMAFPEPHCERIHYGPGQGLQVSPPTFKGGWPAYCPDCGCMMEVDFCAGCQKYFVRLGSGGDDIVREAGVTSSGDILCFECAQEDEEYEFEEDDEY